jgi:hypothetical protein
MTYTLPSNIYNVSLNPTFMKDAKALPSVYSVEIKPRSEDDQRLVIHFSLYPENIPMDEEFSIAILRRDLCNSRDYKNFLHKYELTTDMFCFTTIIPQIQNIQTGKKWCLIL